LCLIFVLCLHSFVPYQLVFVNKVSHRSTSKITIRHCNITLKTHKANIKRISNFTSLNIDLEYAIFFMIAVLVKLFLAIDPPKKTSTLTVAQRAALARYNRRIDTADRTHLSLTVYLTVVTPTSHATVQLPSTSARLQVAVLRHAPYIRR